MWAGGCLSYRCVSGRIVCLRVKKEMCCNVGSGMPVVASGCDCLLI